jgi:serine/threonine-protein kinase
MTPEQWHRIDELFHAALERKPAEREAWLRRACGRDETLRAEVKRLLAQDDRASRVGFLTPPEGQSALPDETVNWPPRSAVNLSSGPPSVDRAWNAVQDTGCFAKKAAICAGTGPNPSTEAESVVRARLRELAIFYFAIFAAATVAGRFIYSYIDQKLFDESPKGIALLVLAGIIALLSTRLPLSNKWLRALELGMVGGLAGLVSFIEYQLILGHSLREDPMMAQITMKNVVLMFSILILTSAIYVPKSWRRAALIVGPLAVLPFATLLLLYLRHPEALAWLGHGWRKSESARVVLFSFDAMLLVTLALGSVYGARMLSRLRREVVAARQLGQYRLRRRIGAGGMGEVYLAEHQLLKRPCALKLIRQSRVADPSTLARFEREVQITATLSHPNTIEIFDYGRTEDGTYYYVMEYLPGMSLADLVERHGPLPPERAVYLLRQVCQALAEAHESGLIHRDIKPSNIFAAQRGGRHDVAKLLDFGLVLPAATAHVPHLSAEGQVVGTPQFMSPEQALGARELDERSDIYSLGAVAYCLLTGRPPFEADTGMGVMIAHARDRLVPPSNRREGIPDDLERVVVRCLEKDPSDRFQDASSLDEALADCACASAWDARRARRWWREVGPAGPVQVPVG